MTSCLSTVTACALAATLAAPPAQAQPPQPTHRPDHLQHRFDDPERFARSFDDPERDEWQMPSRVIDALNLRADSLVADIGAGTGYFTMRLAKAVSRGTVYAGDIEPAMLDHIRKRAHAEHVLNIVTVQASPERPNLPVPVDVILIVNTYHHLPSRTTYFGALRSSLTGTGRVAIVDYRKDAPSGPPMEFRFEPEQIIEEMRQAGYRLDARHEFLPHQLSRLRARELNGWSGLERRLTRVSACPTQRCHTCSLTDLQRLAPSTSAAYAIVEKSP
jgi:SAM-dependent methyltransferase